jgi:hypothetical protein
MDDLLVSVKAQTHLKKAVFDDNRGHGQAACVPARGSRESRLDTARICIDMTSAKYTRDACLIRSTLCKSVRGTEATSVENRARARAATDPEGGRMARSTRSRVRDRSALTSLCGEGATVH